MQRLQNRFLDESTRQIIFLNKFENDVTDRVNNSVSDQLFLGEEHGSQTIRLPQKLTRKSLMSPHFSANSMPRSESWIFQ